MKKIFLSFVFLSSCFTFFHCNYILSGPQDIDKGHQTSAQHTNQSIDTAKVIFASCARSAHIFHEHKRHQSEDYSIQPNSNHFSKTAQSKPIDMPSRGLTKSPSCSDLSGHLLACANTEEASSPASTLSCALLLHSPHSETTSVLSVRSTPSSNSTGSSPNGYDLFNAARESYDEVGLEAEKREAFMKSFAEKLGKWTASKNKLSQSALQNSNPHQ